MTAGSEAAATAVSCRLASPRSRGWAGEWEHGVRKQEQKEEEDGKETGRQGREGDGNRLRTSVCCASGLK